METPLARVPLVPSDSEDPAIKPILDAIRASGSEPLYMHRVMANARNLFEPMVGYAQALRALPTVPRAYRELIILRVTHLAHGDYEFTQHRPMAISCGLTAQQVDAVGSWRLQAQLFDERQGAVLAYADAMLSEAGVDDASFAALEQFFPAEEIVELTLTAAFYAGSVIATRALAVQLEPNAGQTGYGCS